MESTPDFRHKFLSEIPLSDLREAAFTNLGASQALGIMEEFNRQSQAITGELREYQARMSVRGFFIGVAAGFGIPALVMMSGRHDAETVQATRTLLENFAIQVSLPALSGIAGGAIGSIAGEVVNALTNPHRGRRDQLLENHRELLAQQLSDDQLGALFIKAVSGSEE